MIVEPTNLYEQMACQLMYLILHKNLMTVNCRPINHPIKGEGCEMNIQWSSQAVEQISALINEWLDKEYIEEEE